MKFTVGCNFNHGLCHGWTHVYNQDDFDWTNQHGSTPSYSTGPSSGHGGFGKYMYIETSLPRKLGDNAILEYSVPSNDEGKSSCLSFYYHMYGKTVNSLNVFNGGTKVFTKSGNQGNQWLRAKISITTLQNTIKFEGIAGTSFTGDIAIDDVSLVPGICQECKEILNQSFGRLDIKYTKKFDPYCKWVIRNGGIGKKFAVISIHQAYFGYYSEYVKVFDGNGTEVLSIDRWDLSLKKRFQEISFGSSGNITIQASLAYSWSYFKIDYGIVNQGLDSARPLANWNLTVPNKTTASIRVVWNNPVNLFSYGKSFYVAIAERLMNGSSVSKRILLPGYTTSSEITKLDIYTEYSIYVIFVDSSGSPFKSEVFVTITEEGFPSRAPSGVRVTSVDYTTDLLVEWNSLSQIYANGKILGYTTYYREYNDWYSPHKTINTSRPYPTQLVLKGLKPAERYRVAVAAFTSKGRGPMSYYTYGTTGCSQTLREAFGEIKYSPNNYYYLRCYLSIKSGGIPEAIAIVSVQEINLRYCSDYVKIIDGNDTDVLYHNGCKEQFAPEILFDVHFGSSNNISIQVSASSSSSSIKIEYAIVRQSLTSAVVVSGWNISVSNPDSSGATLQWTSLDANVNHQANFYIIEVKSLDGFPLDVHTVPGNTTTSVIKRLKPSTKYRVVVYGVDTKGQPYMSSHSFLTTSKVLCGARPSSTRIVGGTVATINSWPWQVMLIEYRKQFCGGSLVDPYWVITAAHCVQRKSASNLKIKVGAHYRTSGSVGTEQDITVSKIIVHENYQNPYTYSNDIAILKLEKPAVLGVGVGLVCLPDIKNILPVDLNETCWITGWGDLYSAGYQPNTLMQASVPLVSKQRCSNVYPGKIDDSMLCAGLDQGGIDTCQGDSGGPLVCEFNGTWHLEGITSWGHGCAQAYKYGVYAKVRALDSWVRANMYKVVPPTSILPHNQSSVSLVWCSFDSGFCSGWSQSSSDDFDWTIGSGSTPSSSTGPSSGQGGSGNYLYIEASSPRKTGEKAQIVITFEGVRGGSYTSDIAIDQVLITEGNCPVSCSFDNGLCLWWSQSKSDVFDWRLGSGYTPSSGTGPSSDRSGTGMYMYTEASYQLRGDNAKLELSVPSGRSSSCLIFYYHMYGSTMGTLNVFNGNNKIFTKSGNQGFYWKKVTKTLHLSDVLTFEGIIGTSVSSDIAIDDVSISDGNCPGCGGVLNKSSGVVHLANTGNEDETNCIWTIGNAGLRQSYASLSLQRVYLRYCSEHVKIFHEDGTELFNQGGCQSSLPYGTSLEIPFGFSNHITVDISLQYRWSAVNIQYIISKQGHNSAQPIFSWNTTVEKITSSSATVRWSNFPLSPSINHYLVRFKEVSGVSTLFQVSSYRNYYYTNRLKGYTSYDVEVLAVTVSDGNITYSSKTASMKTAEGGAKHGGHLLALRPTEDKEPLTLINDDRYVDLYFTVPSRAPSNVRAASHGLNEFLVEWDPLPHKYANGRLLGYKVYYKDTNYYYWSEKSVITSNADESQVVLGGVQTGRRYKIAVIAFTSKGEGPRSPDLYVTKAELVPSWNISISNTTTTSMRVQWSNFPLTSHSIQKLLVNYREHNSNVSLIFQTPSYYNTHYTGRVLRSYQYYDVQVVAVASNSSNGTYTSRKEMGRTEEGVPSTAPLNVRLTNLQSHEVKVQWDPIPPETANGILLGYRVFYQEYWYSGLLRSVDTMSPDVHILLLRGLKSAQRYQISVAAFTSKGAGSRSYLRYITTGCGGKLNESFGQVHVGSNRNYYSNYLSCTWNIVNVGMQQAVAFIWISDSYFSYSSGYLKILNGNGSVVLHQHRYSTVRENIFLEVEFGNADNITLQSYLASRYSHFQLSYGILKQGLQSAFLTANWNVTVKNVASTSVSVFWTDLELLIGDQVLHYISLIRIANGSSVSNAVITSGNTTSGNISGLSAYTEYQISIVGVGSDGQAHNSSKLTFWTDEGAPSGSPSNVRLSNLQHSEIQVQWEPLAQHYVNGRLQGYRVRVYEYGYYYYGSLVQTLETPGPYVRMMKVGGLKAAQQYRVTVAAFTSKGEGPQSYWRYITTGCGGSVNQSFGEIQVGRRGYYSSYLRCNWEIGNSGIKQPILIVSFEDLYISRYSEYVKIIDGNGVTVFHHSGYSSSPLKTFLLVQYGSGNSVKAQIYFYNRWSQFKLQYGIVNQDLQSAVLVSNWSVTIGNTTKRSIGVQWQNLNQLLNQQILHLLGLLQTSNGTIMNAKIMPGNTTYLVFDGLSSYTQYSVAIVGVDNNGKAYKSGNITAWTDEGVPSKGPLNISIENVESTEITVQWDPLPQQYVNGKLLGYRVYFHVSAYYYFRPRNNNVTINATKVTLTGLNPGQWYYVYVSAFTSKGEGPRSYYRYVKTACKITLNQSAGLIDVTHTDYNNLYCNWTISNFGITNAVALFLFKQLAFVSCSEHVKIFSGSGTLEYHKSGCCPKNQGYLVEIPFMKSDNIAVNILLTRVQSHITSHFVILKHGLRSATFTPGWLASVDNITSSSLQIQWNNLSSLINQEILHYIIYLLPRTKGNPPHHVLVDGGRLNMEIDGLEHSQMYHMTVFGVDALGYCYKTFEVNATMKNASCGSRPNGTRIVGGSIASVNSWPWQAMLKTSYGSQFCGGTLIHPLWVVTATHCVRRKSASSVKVVLGAHYRSYGNVGTEQSFDVVKIIEHERYNSPKRFSNDIALLQLSKPAKLGKGVGLVCLPDTSFQLPFDNPNKKCWITGWGRLSYLGISPNELMQVDIPLVSKQRCIKSYPGKIDDSMICVGQDQGGIGGCHGDSGGPLVCEFNGKWYLEGATSWGGLPCANPLNYTVYANIRHLKSWITSKMYSLPAPGLTVFNRSCTFDTSLCSGWKQSVSDDFDWRRKRGSTGSWATGPSSDHTSGSGYYMYIETSYPRVMGDKAKLDLSLCGNGDVACITFYYHMYGSSMGTLNVFSGNTVVFSASGNKGNHWKKAERSIYLDKVVTFDGMLTFEGIVGNSSSGDIAIDDVSISGGNCPGQTLPPRWYPVPTTLKPSIQAKGTQVVTFKPTAIPRTPSTKEMQEAVMLKMTNFDMNKWKEMEVDFKREVASAASRYCAAGGASCQTSRRRRRSSESMVFSEDMVHIVPGYPKQSPDNLKITLLAFYLHLPGNIGDNFVSEDVLKRIVKSDMKSIEGSMGVRITTVQSMPSTQSENDEEDKKDDEKSTSIFVILGAALGALLLLGIIISVAFCIKTTRFGSKCQVQSSEKVYQGIDKGREAIHESTKRHEVTFSKPSGITYDNGRYVSKM
ncbi:Transmembrane protease serine 5 [Stylophora pistillata]|uniref:Transmembrane protease serine 5 n=1 Tax=Stylophora pistillata TaxID=50429 RepID=A0A2B4SGQ9_STYPI|nr:Transmembrane protease serine 5 [Stylophora pistillata]